MKTRIVVVTALMVISVSAGYYFGQRADKETRTKETAVRYIVRTTHPDGTIKEIIKEKEKRKIVQKENKKRMYHIRASYGPEKPDTFGVGVGYRVFENISITADYVRQNGSDTGMIGVQVDF